MDDVGEFAFREGLGGRGITLRMSGSGRSRVVFMKPESQLYGFLSRSEQIGQGYLGSGESLE
jgi:hypothetical protein